MKEKIKEVFAKTGAFFALATAQATHMVYNDAFESATTGVKDLKDRLVELAKVLFPLAIVICAVSMFFTRDQKKFDTEKHILIGCCLAYVLVWFVSSEQGDMLTDTIESIMGGE